MTIEIHISDEDNDEIQTFVQLGRVEGGTELISEIVKDSATEAHSHVVEATIDLNNREAYIQILDEEIT